MESIDENLYNAISNKNLKAIISLLNEGANINAICSAGRSPLGMAAGLGNLPILQTLLSSIVCTTVPEKYKNRDRDSQQNYRHKKKHIQPHVCNVMGEVQGNSDQSLSHENSCRNGEFASNERKHDLRELHSHDSVFASHNERTSLANNPSGSGCNLGYFVVIHDDRDSSSYRSGNIGDSSICQSTVDANWNSGRPTTCGLNDVKTPDGMDKLEWDVEVDDVVAKEDDSDSFSSLYRWYADILDKTSSLLQGPQRGDVNHQDVFGRCAVHYAAEHGCVHALRLLTSAGCRVDIGDLDNLTPLHLAASRDHCAVAEFLLKSGISVNRKTSDKTSSLHIAASRGFVKMVQLLLDAGAHVDSLDSSDRTSLMVAVSRGHDEVIQLLIRHGAKVNVEEIHGYTPLCEAVWQKAVLIVQMLLDAGAKITQSHYLLHYSILHRHVEMAKLLLKAGSIANLRDDSGNTPLILAAMTGHSELSKLLLVNGASANYPNALTGSTPLHEAVETMRESEYSKFEQVFTVLRSHGALLNIQTCTGGDTPLFRAILLEKYQAAMLLIRHGSDVNLCDSEICFADNLCLAMKRRHFPLARLIVYAGFNLRSSTPYLQQSSVLDPDTLNGWLTCMKYNPLRLTDLCRLVIRGQCGENVFSKINSSFLPTILKKFILLEDL